MGSKHRLGVWLGIIVFSIMPAYSVDIGWDPEVPISSVDGAASYLSWTAQRSIAIGQDGRIHVVWHDAKTPPYPDIYWGIWYRNYDGTVWSPETCISVPIYGPSGYLYNYTNEDASIAILNPTQVHVWWDGFDWQFFNGFAIYGVSQDNGYTWQYPQDPAVWQYWAAEPPSGFNSLCSDGNNYLLFYDQQWYVDPQNPIVQEYRLLGGFSTDGGSWWGRASWQGWSTEDQSDMIPCTACDSNDTGYLVWQSLDNSNNAIIMFGISTGSSGDESLLVPYPGAGYRGDAFIESNLNGRLYVVWSDSRNGNYEIYFKKSLDGGSTWSPDMRLTNAPGDSRAPAIILGNPDKIYLVWIDSRNGNPKIYFKYSINDGLSWSQDTVLTSNTATCEHPHIMISPDKMSLYVIWNDYRDGQPEIYFKKGIVPIGICESQQETTINSLIITPTVFRQKTDIRLQIPDKQMQKASALNQVISLHIYDISGRIVKSFNLPADIWHRASVITWEGTDNAGERLRTGTYFIRLEANSYTETKKVILLE